MDGQPQEPRCDDCGQPLTRQVTGTLSLSASALCPECERSG